jgi:hypothetical protein
MDKIIVTFHDFDGVLIKRAVTHVVETACVSPSRAIARLFSTSMYQTERDNTYSACFHWVGTNVVNVYNYVPLSDSKPNWVWESSYVPIATSN